MIRILPPEEAIKIAAGEVIDRPAALVRELIDNALDSGAVSIDIAIEDGGIGKVEVIDNGLGMSREDLALCTKTHATSKIQSLDDLSRSTTLGFRGEALAAAAAVARLEILSSVDGREAWLLKTFPGSEEPLLAQIHRTKGTSVRAMGLFDTIPARKRFLKRSSHEAALCRHLFIEKALAFPGVSFRFTEDGRLKLQLLAQAVPDTDNGQQEKTSTAALERRFGEAFLSPGERVFLHHTGGAEKGFTVTVIFGGPELYRRDRRQQFIFANKRRIQDYSLMQALEYGLAGFFPNGSHPVGAVFVEVDPALADFNIHPAKREVRFAEAGAIHHCISSALRNYVNVAYGGADTAPVYGYPSSDFFSRESHELAMEALLNRRNECSAAEKQPEQFSTGGEYVTDREYAPPAEAGSFPVSGLPAAEFLAAGYSTAGPSATRLAGRAFDLFIIAERAGRLYLIDQHAAHERILYNRFLSKPIVTQALLAAIPFTAGDADEDRFLETKKEELARLGIVLENDGEGAWRIEALPAGWKEGDGKTVEAILALKTAGTNMAEHWAAALACRAAIKDGGRLDDGAALALAEEVLALAEEGRPPRCPHGRPLWLELSREYLYRAVRRIE